MSVFSIFARIYGLRLIISNLQSLPITKHSFFVETIIRNRNHEAKAEILGTVIYKIPKWPPELLHSDMPMPLLWLRDLYFFSRFPGWTWDLFLSIECNETDTELVPCLALKRPGRFIFQPLGTLRYRVKKSDYFPIETKQRKMNVAWAAYSCSRHSHWGTFQVS